MFVLFLWFSIIISLVEISLLAEFLHMNLKATQEFWRKFGFWIEIWNFDQHFDFWSKFWYTTISIMSSVLTKISIFAEQNLLFWSKVFDFGPIFWFSILKSRNKNIYSKYYCRHCSNNHFGSSGTKEVFRLYDIWVNYTWASYVSRHNLDLYFTGQFIHNIIYYLIIIVVSRARKKVRQEKKKFDI